MPIKGGGVPLTLLNMLEVEAHNTGVSLTTSDFGKAITVDSATAQTVNLPSVSSDEVGEGRFTIIKLGAGQVTIQAADTDTIADSSAGGTVYNAESDEDYAAITLRLAAETEWVVSEGAHGTWITT